MSKEGYLAREEVWKAVVRRGWCTPFNESWPPVGLYVVAIPFVCECWLCVSRLAAFVVDEKAIKESTWHMVGFPDFRHIPGARTEAERLCEAPDSLSGNDRQPLTADTKSRTNEGESGAT